MALASEEYRLHCTLRGHQSDVRSVATTAAGKILTASRDKSARLWLPQSGGYVSETEYTGHTGYVTSICSLHPSDQWPDGLTFTGSRDSTILVYNPSCVSALQQLKGHTDTVSCLVSSGGLLVSGSWDHTARLWSTTAADAFPCIAELKAHAGPLWAVALLPEGGGLLTAAADKLVYLWHQNKVAGKFSGHTDCVRDLAVINASSFLSCSNDASIRRWNIETSQCIDIFYGHTNFVYSLSLISDTSGSFRGFVSGSEDRTLRVWSASGNCRQTVHLPCQSAWSVAVLPNTDVVVGCSDGTCRIFTASCERAAAAEELQAYADEVAAAVRPAAAELGDIQKDKLPDKSALLRPGQKDGHTIMVREEGKVMCYSWSVLKGTWEAVGEVVGGTGGSSATSGKVLHQGKEYDYVFSVELDEGGSLKLPYNNSEDPYMVAQKFIDTHQLPQDHLDQVAQFIITNSKSAPSAAPASSFDPFTGGNRYIPGSGTSNGTSNSPSGGDPYTSVSSYSGAGRPHASSHYPQQKPLLFEACNEQGITAKFKETNKLVAEQVRLSESEVDDLLKGVFGSENATIVKTESLGPLEKALQWSNAEVWPSLDLLRLSLRSRELQERWIAGNKGSGIVNLLLMLLKPPSPANTQLLALRYYQTCDINLRKSLLSHTVITVATMTILDRRAAELLVAASSELSESQYVSFVAASVKGSVANI
ncbi:hypothetical protein HAZT_HAZT008381 [Hyalella azteca]|uniref:Phospholipase A-2-activating protein n=1 Tax=Hyalella azteca TaxID=294128 RepID=A0A6A0H0I4_HYAAZ|nr:hypothetical protein HAZT_HAZT008381 [Hyalella azteca]